MFQLTDDDNFFDFDNENFLQGIFDTNKHRKANQPAECLVTTSPTKDSVPLENVNARKSSSNLLGNFSKSTSNKDGLKPVSTFKRNAFHDGIDANTLKNLSPIDKLRVTKFQKSPCRPQNQFSTPTFSLKEHSNNTTNNNVNKMGNKTAQTISAKTLHYQAKGQTSWGRRPSPTSPMKNGSSCKKRSLNSVGSPKTPVLEKKQFLNRIETITSTISKVSSTSSSVPTKKNKRLSERLGLSNQSSGALLENQSWRIMLSESDIFTDVLARFTINWAIKMSSLNLLRNDQVPILIVSLKSINETSKGSHFVTLQDKTGEMEGDIHWINSRFQNVKPGDVFLLREATLFSPTPGVKKHSVIIIPRNIICVWQSNTEEERYCIYEKPHLTAKVRLWLRESGNNYSNPARNGETCQPISNAQSDTAQASFQKALTSSSPRSTSNKSKSNISEEESLWEDETFEEIIKEGNLDEMFKDDDETEKLLAKLDF